MGFQIARCPACDGALRLDIQGPVSIYAAGASYDIHRCDDCGLGVTLPVPSRAELARIYAEIYRYDSHALIASEKRWRARRILGALQPEPFDSLLDVGCMYGYLLREARLLGVRRLHGIEPSEAPAARAREQGFEVSRGELEDYARSQPDSFDVIVAQHVLEHVVDFRSFLSAVFSLLAPGGRLVVCVPHFGSWMQRVFRRSWGWYQVPVHLLHYSRAALARICRSNGFEVESLSLRGGDSLMILLSLICAARGAAISASREITGFQKVAVSGLSVVLRPYYYVGNEEIVALMRKPGAHRDLRPSEAVTGGGGG